MKGNLIILILLICIILAAPPSSLADIPEQINYQGRLTDADGEVVDGPQLIKFNIYGSETGSDSLWWTGFQMVQVDRGFFEYQLGSLIPLPDDLFASGSVRYLGITIGTDAETVPRTRIVSSAYAYHALRSDTAAYAKDIADNSVSSDKIQNQAVTNSQLGFESVTTDNIQNYTIYFEDINRNGAADGEVIKWNNATFAWEAAGTGEITDIMAGAGLTGGGQTGSVTLSIDGEGVTTPMIDNNAVTSDKIGMAAVTSDKLADASVSSAKIINQTIVDNDINPSADIDPTKISGTAATISAGSSNTFDNPNYFNEDVNINKNFVIDDISLPGSAYTQFYDSSLRITDNGIRIGNNSDPSSTYLVRLHRTYATSSARSGVYITMDNTGAGTMYGVYSDVEHLLPASGGTAYAFYGKTETNGADRYGLFAETQAKTLDYGVGNSYGARCRAYDGSSNYGLYGYAGSATNQYGVYGSAGGSDIDYGVYCYGNLHSTGLNTKGGGGYKIDHPLDPENQYLFHNDVSSPDMMNIYNGNITLDAKGEATVELPEYFESLNQDFRYQLTCIGNYAPVYIAQKISGNRFVIAGGLPFMEISWLVTGVRKDAFASSTRKQVETEKPNAEKGYYMHPEAFGYDLEKSTNYNNDKDNLNRQAESEE